MYDCFCNIFNYVYCFLEVFSLSLLLKFALKETTQQNKKIKVHVQFLWYQGGFGFFSSFLTFEQFLVEFLDNFSVTNPYKSLFVVFKATKVINKKGHIYRRGKKKFPTHPAPIYIYIYME